MEADALLRPNAMRGRPQVWRTASHRVGFARTEGSAGTLRPLLNVGRASGQVKGRARVRAHGDMDRAPRTGPVMLARSCVPHRSAASSTERSSPISPSRAERGERTNPRRVALPRSSHEWCWWVVGTTHRSGYSRPRITRSNVAPTCGYAMRGRHGGQPLIVRAGVGH